MIPNKVFGTTPVSNKKVKKTYRNVIQIQSNAVCDDDTLLLLKDSLDDQSFQLDVMDGPKGMMSIEYLYSNIGSDSALVDGEYDTCDNGLWIQVLRDNAFRDAATDCVKSVNKKKKDCYLLLLNDLSGRINGDDSQMEKVNACLESATVFQMQDSAKDMTKCMSYKACNIHCSTTGEDCVWPSDETTTSTTTTTTTTTTTSTTTTTTSTTPELLHPDLIPDASLPDFNNLACQFTCGVDGDETKCTLGTNSKLHRSIFLVFVI